MKYNDNGEYKDIYVKAFDTLPVGTEVDYDGSTVPSGWTEIDDPNTYSTNEIKIGTWIDGKPLYRKVFTGTTSTTISNYMLTNTNNIAKLIGYKGYIEQSSTVQLPIGDSTYHQDSGVTMRTRIINVNNNLRLDCSMEDFAGKYFEVAVEYTKTTD